MAIKETSVLLTGKDSNGDKQLLYPITKIECVEGTEELASDWNEPDETLSTFIKNKPCYCYSEQGSMPVSPNTVTSGKLGIKAIQNLNIYTSSDLANSDFVFSSGNVIANIYEDDNSIPNGGYGLIPESETIVKILSEDRSVELDYPHCAFQYKSKSSNGDISIGGIIVIGIRYTPDDFYIQLSSASSSATNYSISPSISSKLRDKIGLFCWFSKSNPYGYYLTYEIRKSKQLDEKLLPNSVITEAKKTLQVSESSTDKEYPTAKAVWNALSGNQTQADWNETDETSSSYIKNKPEIEAIPTKLSQLQNDSGFVAETALEGKEDIFNKIENYNGYDGTWDEATTEKYPSAKAVRDFVASYVGTYAMTSGSFAELYKLFIQPEMSTVELDTMTWDGSTDGLTNFLGMFYKISDSTSFPDMFKAELSKISNGAITPSYVLWTGFSHLFTNVKITELKEAFGIVVYSFGLGDFLQPLIVVADRAGTLPATVIEQFTGENPGVDVPYEAGTYVYYNEQSFVSKAVSCMSVKNYIDKTGAEIKDTLVNWDGNTEGLSNVLEMFWKVSNNTYVPQNIVYKYASKDSDGNTTLDAAYQTYDGIMTDLAETYGIYVPTINGNYGGIIICKTNGVLPSAVASAFLGEDVPTDVPYESGTYILNRLLADGTRTYLAEAFYTTSVKKYIDDKFEELKLSSQNNT